MLLGDDVDSGLDGSGQLGCEQIGNYSDARDVVCGTGTYEPKGALRLWSQVNWQAHKVAGTGEAVAQPWKDDGADTGLRSCHVHKKVVRSKGRCEPWDLGLKHRIWWDSVVGWGPGDPRQRSEVRLARKARSEAFRDIHPTLKLKCLDNLEFLLLCAADAEREVGFAAPKIKAMQRRKHL
jgi:hypothetical protein